MSNHSIPQTPKRAILYARVSGDDRKYATSSIDGQLEMCRQYAQKKGYQIIGEFSEDADKHTSGADWELPAINEALEIGHSGLYDVMITRELDRFARDLARQLVVESQFKSAGVQLEYVLGEYPDTPEGNLMKNIRAVIAEYERLKTEERLMRGRRRSAAAGNVLTHGTPAYAYERVKEDKKVRLVIDENEAKTVRMIFNWYTEDGIGMIQIAKRLTEMGIPTPTGNGKRRPAAEKRRKRPSGEWGKSTVGVILGNETYAGTWHYGKSNADVTVRIAVPVPAIISTEQFHQAQLQRQKNYSNAKRNTKHDYLLRRLAICGCCHAKMRVRPITSKDRQHHYYQCSVPNNEQMYARACTQKSFFNADDVDATVWEYIETELLDLEKLRKNLSICKDEQEQKLAPYRARLVETDKVLASYRGQLGKLLDLFLTDETFSKELLLERKNGLEETITNLENKRRSLTDKLAAMTAPVVEIDDILAFAAETREAIKNADFETRRDTVQKLNLQVTLTVENRIKIAHVDGHLGPSGPLAIAPNRTSPDDRNLQYGWLFSTRLIVTP